MIRISLHLAGSGFERVDAVHHLVTVGVAIQFVFGGLENISILVLGYEYIRRFNHPQIHRRTASAVLLFGKQHR
ncbi:MAG: hypothetical protein RLZZ146_1432, partial [Bacteroidota bacterium]